MPVRHTSRAWRVGQNNSMGAARIAPKVARLQLEAALHYRDVHLEIEVVDSPHHDVSEGRFYRVFRVQAVSWPPLELPHHQQLPEHWQSEVISVPRHEPGDPRARLTAFEAEFAVRGFLYRIEREIDGVFLRAAEHSGSWPRRDQTPEPGRPPVTTSVSLAP